MRRLRAFAAAPLLAMAAAACGGASAATCIFGSGTTIPVPGVLGGLDVKPSSKAADALAKVANESNSYYCDGAVFELRKGKELRAVFEVVRLSDDARPEKAEFRKTIVEGIGATTRKPERIADQLVYTATQNQQIFLVWFQDRFMEVLIVREDQTIKGQVSGIDSQRLLNEALSLKPTGA